MLTLFSSLSFISFYLPSFLTNQRTPEIAPEKQHGVVGMRERRRGQAVVTRTWERRRAHAAASMRRRSQRCPTTARADERTWQSGGGNSSKRAWWCPRNGRQEAGRGSWRSELAQLTAGGRASEHGVVGTSWTGGARRAGVLLQRWSASARPVVWAPRSSADGQRGRHKKGGRGAAGGERERLRGATGTNEMDEETTSFFPTVILPFLCALERASTLFLGEETVSTFFLLFLH